MNKATVSQLPVKNNRPSLLAGSTCRLDGVLAASQYYLFIEGDRVSAAMLLQRALEATRDGLTHTELTDQEAELINNSDHLVLVRHLLQTTK